MIEWFKDKRKKVIIEEYFLENLKDSNISLSGKIVNVDFKTIVDDNNLISMFITFKHDLIDDEIKYSESLIKWIIEGNDVSLKHGSLPYIENINEIITPLFKIFFRNIKLEKLI